MMTWMTRMSLLDTADDLDLARAATAAEDSAKLAYALVYDDLPAELEKHPVVRIWQGYEVALAAYSVAMEIRLVQMGVTSGLRALETAKVISELRRVAEAEFVMPPWTEDTAVLQSHRSNLTRRWPAAFGKTWKGTPANMPYVWPFIDEAEESGYKLMLSSYDKKLLATGERALPSKILERIHNK